MNQLTNDQKLVRKVVLDYMQQKADAKNPYSVYGPERVYTVKDICLSKAELDEALDSIIHSDGSKLTEDEREKLIDIIKKDAVFSLEDGQLEVVKIPLEHRFNITINYIKDNVAESIIGAVGVTLMSTMLIGSVVGGLAYRTADDKFQNSIVVQNDHEYSMKDIYAVYDSNNVYFCTRKISKVTEDEKIEGHFRMGSGSVNEFYYRDDIYEYYDIKTGKKVCQDHEDGFYIENLLSLYNMDDMKEKEYKINLREVVDDIDINHLLSRNPGVRRK